MTLESGADMLMVAMLVNGEPGMTLIALTTIRLSKSEAHSCAFLSNDTKPARGDGLRSNLQMLNWTL